DVDYPATFPGFWAVTLQTDQPGYTFQTTPNQNVIVLTITNGIRVGGTPPDVNAALEGMQLIPPGRPTGSTVLTVTTNDGGLEGSGGPFVDPHLQDVDSIPVTFDAAAVGVSIDDVTLAEGNKVTSVATFTVRLTREAPGATVHYSTADGTATDAARDYEPVDGVLTFGRGETQKTVSVLVDSDLDFEPDETFFVNLGDANGGTTI